MPGSGAAASAEGAAAGASGSAGTAGTGTAAVAAAASASGAASATGVASGFAFALPLPFALSAGGLLSAAAAVAGSAGAKGSCSVALMTRWTPPPKVMRLPRSTTRIDFAVMVPSAPLMVSALSEARSPFSRSIAASMKFALRPLVVTMVMPSSRVSAFEFES